MGCTKNCGDGIRRFYSAINEKLKNGELETLRTDDKEEKT